MARMDPDLEPTTQRPRMFVMLGVLLALYLASYFPVFSYLVRHPEHQRYSAIYRPIPLRLWLKVDPAGGEITNRTFEEHRTAAGLTK